MLNKSTKKPIATNLFYSRSTVSWILSVESFIIVSRFTNTYPNHNFLFSHTLFKIYLKRISTNPTIPIFKLSTHHSTTICLIIFFWTILFLNHFDFWVQHVLTHFINILTVFVKKMSTYSWPDLKYIYTPTFFRCSKIASSQIFFGPDLIQNSVIVIH